MDPLLKDTREYDAAYFAQFYAAIPDHRWCSGVFHRGSASCALGHLGRFSWRDQTPRAQALEELFLRCFHCSVHWIADGHHSQYRQATPRERMVQACQDISTHTVNQ